MKNIALALAVIAVPLASASAQADLGFSGGSGTPLTMTLFSPVTYEITLVSPYSTYPIFQFVGVGDVFAGFPSVVSSLTYTVNGGTPFTINVISSGYVGGSVNADDPYVYGDFTTLAVGDVVTLSSGTITTDDPFAGAAPASGLYRTWISGDQGLDISTDGTSSVTPEPATITLLATGLVGLMGAGVRRRKKRA